MRVRSHLGVAVLRPRPNAPQNGRMDPKNCDNECDDRQSKSREMHGFRISILRLVDPQLD